MIPFFYSTSCYGLFPTPEMTSVVVVVLHIVDVIVGVIGRKASVAILSTA